MWAIAVVCQVRSQNSFRLRFQASRLKASCAGSWPSVTLVKSVRWQDWRLRTRLTRLLAPATSTRCWHHFGVLSVSWRLCRRINLLIRKIIGIWRSLWTQLKSCSRRFTRHLTKTHWSWDSSNPCLRTAIWLKKLSTRFIRFSGYKLKAAKWTSSSSTKSRLTLTWKLTKPGYSRSWWTLSKMLSNFHLVVGKSQSG